MLEEKIQKLQKNLDELNQYYRITGLEKMKMELYS